MTTASGPTLSDLGRDLVSGLVVFLVALPLCLGIALASDAPLFAGLVAGVVGGIVVGLVSGSHTSVSGPAAGLTAVVAAQIASLGSFETFLLAVTLAGVIQIGLGVARAGFLAAFFPSAVIKGLLAAIGVIIILKQIPHLVGHDADPEGEMSFWQPDRENTFTELVQVIEGLGLHLGAAVIGVAALALLIAWDRVKWLKNTGVPSPLAAVLLGVGLVVLFARLGDPWSVEANHLVAVERANTAAEFFAFFRQPDFTQWANPKVYLAAFTIAAVASLETLLNLEAVDKLDPRRRVSPASRELLAQGVGNTASGLLGGLPVTAVIIRGSVNIHAGARTKASAVFHGVLLLVSVAVLPGVLNLIPLAALAAILLVTGFKLASPKLFKQMWAAGKYQFAPFVITVAAIVLTDLLIGVTIGLAVSLAFILRSNFRRPVRVATEKHLGGDVVRVELANQVSFLNRAALTRVMDGVPPGGQLLLDARQTDYIDPDVLDLLRDYADKTGPARGVDVSLLGFREKYELADRIQYVDHSTRDLQTALTPQEVLQILKDGNERFRSGRRLTRDLGRQVLATAAGQHPLAAVLSCIDSRTPAELIFDLGVGDVFSTRVAGNVSSRKILGSLEYATAVAGAKLIVVLGHTRCGAVTAALDLIRTGTTALAATGCEHLDDVVADIREAVEDTTQHNGSATTPDQVARRNVVLVADRLRRESGTIDALVRAGRLAIVGGMYDVATGEIEFLSAATTDPLPAVVAS
jgi:carbonic anhydrase